MLSNGFVCLANVLAFAWVNELLHLFFFVIPESVLLVCQSLMGRRKSYSVSLPDHPFPCFFLLRGAEGFLFCLESNWVYPGAE